MGGVSPTLTAAWGLLRRAARACGALRREKFAASVWEWGRIDGGTAPRLASRSCGPYKHIVVAHGRKTLWVERRCGQVTKSWDCRRHVSLLRQSDRPRRYAKGRRSGFVSIQPASRAGRADPLPGGDVGASRARTHGRRAARRR
nr:unnamed protein product [Digitaria exilis]